MSSEAFRITAPGRVNLIGEHTDYNDGFVLPMAIERSVVIEVRPTADRRIVLRSAQVEGEVVIDLAQPIEAGRQDWGRYVAGVVAGYQRLGWQIPGFTATLSATLPEGAGLSSSAALEVAVATAIEKLCDRALSPVDKALLCQRAEHEFAGVPCGIMDQFAVTLCQEGRALLLDCRSRAIRQVDFTSPQIAVLVVHSGVKHALVDGEYALRRKQCVSACRMLGVRSLREVSLGDLNPNALPNLEFRRARHVITENARVQAFVAALVARDWPAAGVAMGASHASLRDDYEVSCPELDLLVELASHIPGIHGCRLTGGGFGGCVVALVEVANAETARAELLLRYRQASGLAPVSFLTRAAPGAKVTPLV